MLDDKNSDISDISFQTDLKVFKGGLGLIKDNLVKESNTKKFNPNINENINIINKKVKYQKKNITINKIKNDNTNIVISHSAELDGQISFRSDKKEKVINTNIKSSSLNNNINLLPITSNTKTVDSYSITRNIINKIDNINIKEKNKFNQINLNTKYENDSINKLFIKEDEDKDKHENEKEIKNFSIEEKGTDRSSESNDLPLVDNENEINVDLINNLNNKNIFFNFITNIEDENTNNHQRSKSVNIIKKKIPYSNNLNISSPSDNDKTFSSKKSSNKEKCLNSIVCTLSKIQKGKGIFVSNEDFIFILPASFISKNMIVGNSYIFRISEFEQFKKKVSNVNEIQKKYLNTYNLKI